MLDTQPQISYAARIAVLAAEHPERVALHFAAIDGREQALTWCELDRRSTQLAHAFASRGLAVGDRIALGLRNSPELVTSILAGWKLGATPVPVRWDLPEWERARVLKVIDARLEIGGEDLPWLRATESDDTTPLPDVISPLAYGICSSGSTGMPKVILIDRPSVFDRRVDVIISGGANVYPAEVESALIDHPGIADVVVIGLRDPEWGRRVHAIVEPSDPDAPPAAPEVIAYAKSRLAAYKVPKTVEFVDRIPRSEATKVSRSALIAEREPTE